MSNEYAVRVEVEHAVERAVEVEREVGAEHADEIEVVCYSTRICRCGADMQLVDRDSPRGGYWGCGTCGRRSHRR